MLQIAAIRNTSFSAPAVSDYGFHLLLGLGSGDVATRAPARDGIDAAFARRRGPGSGRRSAYETTGQSPEIDVCAGDDCSTPRWWRCSISVSLGTAISGELARFYTAENEGTYFRALGGIAIGIAALLAVASPWVLKLMRGVR